MKTTIEQACVTVLEEKTDNKDSFTAYDVTKEMRNRGHWVKHDEVKEFVHDYMEEGINSDLEYSKDYETVGNREKAFVYNPGSTPATVDLTISDLMDD